MLSRAAIMGSTAMMIACVSSPPSREPAVEGEPGLLVEAEPTPRASTSEPEPPTASQPGRECDEYLSLYERCEEHLRPQIMAGDRRFAHAERAWIEHLADTPEAVSLPDACASLLDALRIDCPEQHRTPISSD